MMLTEKPRRTRAPRKNQAPRAKKETAVKRETRSRHEKKRREEMNEVINEMMELLPDTLESVKRVDQKARQPDKCFIIGSSVEMIKNSDYKPSLFTDPTTRDVFGLANSFLIFLNNYIISEIEGDCRPIFDHEKIRMLGKDIRCFLDFQSVSKLSFLDPNQLVNPLELRSFMGKPMTCRLKRSEENPSDAILVCVPDELPVIQRLIIKAPPTFTQITPPKSPPPSKLEEERPILAALLRKKDPEPQASPFLSPSSSSCSTVPQTMKTTVTRKITVPPQKRKRLRSMNVIVESFPLDGKEDEGEEEAKKKKKRQSAPIPTTTTTTTTTITTNYTPTIAHPIPTHSTMTMTPFDVFAPGYKDIWLRLQSERLILEERIVAKEGELKNLMHLVQQPQSFINIPQYLMTPGANLGTNHHQ